MCTSHWRPRPHLGTRGHWLHEWRASSCRGGKAGTRESCQVSTTKCGGNSHQKSVVQLHRVADSTALISRSDGRWEMFVSNMLNPLSARLFPLMCLSASSHQPPSRPPGIITTCALTLGLPVPLGLGQQSSVNSHCRLGIHVHTLLPTLVIFHVPKLAVTRQETGRLEIVRHQPWRGLCRSCSPSPRRDPTRRPQRLQRPPMDSSRLELHRQKHCPLRLGLAGSQSILLLHHGGRLSNVFSSIHSTPARTHAPTP